MLRRQFPVEIALLQINWSLKLVYQLLALTLIISKRNVSLVHIGSLVLRRKFSFCYSWRRAKCKIKRKNHTECGMSFTKSSETTKSNTFQLGSFYHFQYLRVQIDDQGNLVQIVNLNRSIAVPFASQGFYWYEGMSITNMKNFIFFQFEAFLTILKNKIIKHQVLMSFDHSIKLHNQWAHHVQCKFFFLILSSYVFTIV